MSNTIVLAGNQFEIRFAYSTRLVDAVKSHFHPDTRRYDMDNKVWKVNTVYSNEVNLFAKKYGFTFSDGAEKSIQYTQPELPELPELGVEIPLKKSLFPYQRKGVAQGLIFKRMINGDEPGLGKTAQSIATIVGANAFPCLIICPASLKENWKREWEMWTGKRVKLMDEQLVKYHQRYSENGLAVDVWIINYESLKKYFVADITKPEGAKLRMNHIKFWPIKDLFKSVVIDEFHRCKSTATMQSKLVKGIASGKEYILGLTGTPVVNKPMDLYSQLGIIDQITHFGGYNGFKKHYCAGPKEASNLKELNYKLLTNCMVRREKKEVLKDLPDKMRQVVYCNIDNRKEYAAAEADLESYLAQFKGKTADQIERSMKGEVMVRIGNLKSISARGKINDVSEFIDDIIESGEKLVMFAHLHDVVEQLKKKYPKAVSVTGHETSTQKQNAIDQFQNDPKCQLIICSIKAAGVGITLTASSRVAFIELPWHAADAEQCEDRCHRIGQKDSVQCTYFLGAETIDQWIYSIIDGKRGVANTIMGKEEEIETSVIDNIINLFNNRK
jgi:SWI/SNF-related matrix-associated actin-dependent regulator 1 of chromatin subfamily A